MTARRAPVAVVTGASRGLGREVARQLAARGYDVVAGIRHLPSGTGGTDRASVHWHRLDVADPDSIDALGSWLGETQGHVDVLVNNAGVHYDSNQSATHPDFGVVTEALTVNVLGAWRTTAALLPFIGGGGRIVNVSSGAGSFGETDGAAGVPAYSVTKAALNMLTVKLAAELRHRRIAVNAVCPGWVATDMGGPGGRPIAEGANGIIWAATLPDPAPTGHFFRDGQRIPW